MTTRAKRRPSISCCTDWERLTTAERADWAMVVLHRFSHSRVTFGVQRLAEDGRVPVERARELVAEGERRRWIWPAADGVWVGSLPRRR